MESYESLLKNRVLLVKGTILTIIENFSIKLPLHAIRAVMNQILGDSRYGALLENAAFIAFSIELAEGSLELHY